MPNLVQLYQKSGFFKSKILPIVPKVFAGETVFDWIFGVYEDNFHNSGLDYGYPRIAWNTTVEELKWFQQSL